MLTTSDEALQNDIIIAMRKAHVDEKLLAKLTKYRSNTIIFDHMLMWKLTDCFNRKAEHLMSLKEECNFCCN